MKRKGYKILPSGRTPFSWAVMPGERKKFDDICELKGYEKQAQIDRMLKDWIAKEEGKAVEKSIDQSKIKVFGPGEPTYLTIEGRKWLLTELHVRVDEPQKPPRRKDASN